MICDCSIYFTRFISGVSFVILRILAFGVFSVNWEFNWSVIKSIFVFFRYGAFNLLIYAVSRLNFRVVSVVFIAFGG